MQLLTEGYQVAPEFISAIGLNSLTQVLQHFHQGWLKANVEAFDKGAVNSAYLTNSLYLADADRLALFKFIGCNKIFELLAGLTERPVVFMNSQLFFDPKNPEQSNYWHRDPQYHLNLVDQEKSLTGPKVYHLRVALVDEPGIELIPKTHQRWDTEQELDVRLARNGRQVHDALPNSRTIPLKAGDALFFDANVIHRGLYGGNRFALDILFCEPVPELMQFIAADCLPELQMFTQLDNPRIFSKYSEAFACYEG